MYTLGFHYFFFKYTVPIDFCDYCEEWHRLNGHRCTWESEGNFLENTRYCIYVLAVTTCCGHTAWFEIPKLIV